MLTKDNVMLNKYRPYNLSIPELCDTILELYNKLEKAKAEIDAWRNDAILMSDKRRAEKAEAELVELREAVAWYFECILTYDWFVLRDDFKEIKKYHEIQGKHHDPYQTPFDELYQTDRQADAELWRLVEGKDNKRKGGE